MPVEVTATAPGKFSVRGELTFVTAAQADEAGMRAIGQGGSGALEIDCGEVTKADSAGLAVLLDWLAAAEKASVRLSYVNLPEAVSALARISDMEGWLSGG